MDKALLQKKYLAGIGKDGTIYFHEAIAAQLNDVQKFTIVNPKGEISEFKAKVVGVADEAYQAITALALATLLLATSNQESKEQKIEQETPSVEGDLKAAKALKNSSPQLPAKYKKKAPLKNQQVIDLEKKLLQEQQSQNKARQKARREEREKSKQHKREQIKEETIRHEQKHEAIRSEQINIEQKNVQSLKPAQPPGARPRFRQPGT